MMQGIHAEEGSEARTAADALIGAGFDLELSGDYPPELITARGRRLWNVIAADGSHRGQLLLAPNANPR